MLATYQQGAHAAAQVIFFLGSMPHNDAPIQLNGNLAITCVILKIVAVSAAEAELGAIFVNTKEARAVRLMCSELRHPQPPGPICMDNLTDVGIVNSKIKRQRSRSMEMTYFWLLDQALHKYFKF